MLTPILWRNIVVKLWSCALSLTQMAGVDGPVTAGGVTAQDRWAAAVLEKQSAALLTNAVATALKVRCAFSMHPHLHKCGHISWLCHVAHAPSPSDNGVCRMRGGHVTCCSV